MHTRKHPTRPAVLYVFWLMIYPSQFGSYVYPIFLLFPICVNIVFLFVLQSLVDYILNPMNLMSSVFTGASHCVLAVGSVCCSYAGRHTHCREYCQAIFRTDASPTVSQINTVKEYCQSISPLLINCVANYTKSYPTRNPIDSEHTFCTMHNKKLLGWFIVA